VSGFCNFLTLKVFLEEAIEGALFDLAEEGASSIGFSTFTLYFVLTIFVAQ